MRATFEVPEALAGERVDRVLAMLTGRSRAEIAQLVAAGAVLVGGAAVLTRSRKMSAGEVVDAQLPDEGQTPPPVANAQIAFDVVYEDDDLLVVDKPAGLVVHPGAGHRDDTLVSGLLARYPDLATDPDFDPVRPGIVHRLDKETSGLLVVGRSEAMRLALSESLRRREIARTYLCLVRGQIDQERGVIEAPIGRSERDPTRMAIRKGGRFARTSYAVLARFEEPLVSTLLEVHLDTGRTHQIRVHLQAIGHPVIGDRRYGGSTDVVPVKRPFLHAARLELHQPRTDASIAAEAPLPEDLQHVLAALTPRYLPEQ